MNSEEQDAARFGGVIRLYGQNAVDHFRNAHVCIVGIGGVGSWIVESLARSCIGAITMIDLDDVCLTNINRQLPALTETVGRPKIAVMKERIRAINPHCQVHAVAQFLTPSNASQLLGCGFHYVVDCVDRLSIKIAIITTCKQLQVPVITLGGAGGRKDPLRISLCDLNQTSGDRLLKQVRKKLRTEHHFPRGPKKKHGVLAVVSDEPQIFPWADGTCRSRAEPGAKLKMDCASGFGAATHVTATFGFVAAAAILDALAASSTTITNHSETSPP